MTGTAFTISVICFCTLALIGALKTIATHLKDICDILYDIYNLIIDLKNNN